MFTFLYNFNFILFLPQDIILLAMQQQYDPDKTEVTFIRWPAALQTKTGAVRTGQCEPQLVKPNISRHFQNTPHGFKPTIQHLKQDFFNFDWVVRRTEWRGRTNEQNEQGKLELGKLKQKKLEQGQLEQE